MVVYLLCVSILPYVVIAADVVILRDNLIYPALDIAVMFTMLSFFLRYGRGFRSVRGFIIISDILLVLSDVSFVILEYVFREPNVAVILLPLYNIQATMLVIGLYNASKIIIIEENHRNMTRNRDNRLEWFWWTVVVRTFIAISISSAIIIGVPNVWLVGFVIMLTLVRDIVAASDQRRVREELERTTLQSQAFMERVVHDAAAPIQYVQKAVSQIADEQLQSQTEHLINVVN